jgi:alkylated DNA repair dioxygenase AlkB
MQNSLSMFDRQTINLDGGELLLIENWLQPFQANDYFVQLQHSLKWQSYEISLFGKKHRSPRLTAFHGDNYLRYRYSNLTLTAEPWVSPLIEIKQRLFAEFSEPFQVNFNSVLCNYYRDQNDAMGWHADNEPVLGKQPVIASVNFGATRDFNLKHNQTKQRFSVPLPSGSLLLMAGDTQNNWQHAVPCTKQLLGPRINLTFRQIYDC